MNENALESNILDISNKLDIVVAFLSKNKKTDNGDEKASWFDAVKNTFSNQDKDQEKIRRLKQKQKTYQAVPIVIDGITVDGKKEIAKVLKGTTSFAVETKKEEKKPFPWLFVGTVIAGLISGLVKFLYGYIKNFYTVLKTIFSSFKGWWEVLKVGAGDWFLKITGAFKEDGIFGRLWKWIKGLFAEEGIIGSTYRRFKALFTEEGAIGKIIKSMEGLFAEEGVIGGVVKRIRALFSEEGVLGKIFGNIKSFFAEEGTIGKLWAGFKGLFAEEGIIGGFIRSIGNVFKEEGIIGMILSKVRAVKDTLFGWAEGIFKLFEPFLGVFNNAFKFIVESPVFRLAEKAFFWIFALIDVATETFKSVMEQGANLKAVFDGVLGGFLKFITFGLVNFKVVKEYTDKIMKAWKSGNVVESVLRSLALLPELLGDALGQAIGWAVGFFSKEWGKAITDFFKDNSLSDTIAELWNFLWNKIKSLFGMSPKEDTSDYDRAVAKINASKQKKKPVGDLYDTKDRTLFSNGQSYSFDKNDELVALKKGGPIDKIIGRRDEMTNNSIKQLTGVVTELRKSFESYAKSTSMMQQNEMKLMNENMNLLAAIKDKEQKSNVLVNNSSSNLVFNEKSSSNLDFRKDMSHLTRF